MKNNLLISAICCTLFTVNYAHANPIEYQSVAECVSDMKNDSYSAHTLWLDKVQTQDWQSALSYSSLENFFTMISYNRSVNHIESYCKNNQCLLRFFLTCNLLTQYPTVWTEKIMPILSNEAEYLKNGEIVPTSNMHTIPYIDCMVPEGADDSAITAENCNVIK